MSANASSLGFLDLPKSIRESIYSYLLLPHAEEDVTTINYRLHWPYLSDPSNTTFAGSIQIDPCICPREDLDGGDLDHEDSNHEDLDNEEVDNEHLDHEDSHPKSHIYTRYSCHGPEVRFTPSNETLWVLHEALGQFNILRPATPDELVRRPSSAILRVCKQIHKEACPFLYRGRHFIFLTGPCPRGRYQAYATLQWLKQLSSIARAHVEVLSLLVQPYEEDCNLEDVRESYAELGAYVLKHVPRFKWLCLEVCDRSVYQSTRVFVRLFEKKGLGIVVRQPWRNDGFEAFTSKKGFLDSFGMGDE